MISQCMTDEKQQFKLIHVKIDLRKKHDKRNLETKEMLMNVFSTHPFILKSGRPR